MRKQLEENLHHWVNDALMAVFFFVVGLEIKRELVTGKLRDPRTRPCPPSLRSGAWWCRRSSTFSPTSAAQGLGAGGSRWPPTSPSPSVSSRCLLGRGVPASLKLFLLTLAIVDDIGAIIVIGSFYWRR